jgi:hypothetical protein
MHKNQNSKPGGRTLADGVAQINRESGGLLRVEIIRPQDVFALSCAVFSGDGVTICSAICARCSTGSPSQVLERAAAAYQQIWPGLRCVGPVTHPAGGNA